MRGVVYADGGISGQVGGGRGGENGGSILKQDLARGARAFPLTSTYFGTTEMSLIIGKSILCAYTV